MGRNGGGWSVSLRARFFFGGKVAFHASRNTRGAARSTDPPGRHRHSDGWVTRIGASWIRHGEIMRVDRMSGIRRGERRQDDGASGLRKLALAEATEGLEKENSGSRVQA
jgi:hypothetical protein